MISLTPPSFDASLNEGRIADAARKADPRVAQAAPLSFASELASARDEDQATSREAADQLVATAFILPLLQEARNDPFKSDLFHGGRGEEVFGQQLDVIFAENITKSANFGIADAMLNRFQTPTSSHKVNQLG